MPVMLSDVIRVKWNAINDGLLDISDAENPDDQLSCDLLDFMEENLKDERDVLRNLIGETHSGEKLSGIIGMLDRMIKNALKEIDRITR